jgi:DNA-binding protein Alba
MSIVVGKKPLLRYVTAVITLLNRGFSEVEITARGKNIPACVDAINLLKRSFRKDIRIKETSIWSEEYTKDGRKQQISYIKITIETTTTQHLTP